MNKQEIYKEARKELQAIKDGSEFRKVWGYVERLGIVRRD